MSLHRFLPTPSDRMAVMWTMLTIEGAVVLEYGPAGTTHFSMGLFSSMGIDVLSNKLFTTHMSEDDVVMGDVGRLEKAIRELDESRHPEVIFVISSAVTAVIGSDLIGVCSYMQDEVKAKLIAMENSGFGGDFSLGLKHAYQHLVKGLATSPCEKKENTFNILGASANSYRIKSDLNEIKRLLDESLDLHCNTVLGHESSIQELRELGSATVNLVLRDEALPAAKYLQKKYGTPYIKGAPYGYSGTANWLQEIAAICGKTLAAKPLQELAEKKLILQGNQRFMAMFGDNGLTPSAAIVGDYCTIQGFNTIMDEFSIVTTLKICSHTLKTVKNPAAEVSHFKKEKDRINKLEALDYHWILGDDVTLHCSNSTNTKLCVSTPIVNHSQLASHLPFMGIRGADFMREQLSIYLATLTTTS